MGLVPVKKFYSHKHCRDVYSQGNDLYWEGEDEIHILAGLSVVYKIFRGCVSEVIDCDQVMILSRKFFPLVGKVPHVLHADFSGNSKGSAFLSELCTLPARMAVSQS